ncbi:MAG TPA: saccharopine dehydrogenase NADP-binding domain-containing protein [Solirubrobacteraceae bacterium]|nr:saccharopine dehydrogenase NADP-binding domain-containing protein [Solirubrobacteraceae bacterium]
MRVAVLGAGGTIGPALVRDLAESEEVDALTLLDRDGERVRAVADAHGRGKATAAAVDASDPQALTLAIEGAGVLVNAASYRINLHAMDACIVAGCGYIDLGGLYHVTARQLARSDELAERGLLAVLGAGAGPGKTNVMAARAARELDRVARVRCASAGFDADPPPGLAAPYAIQTLLDELTVPAMVMRAGAAEEIAPMTDGGTIAFPDPVGERPSLYTLHSEVLTLPESLATEDADFRLALGPGVLDRLMPLIGRPADEIAALRPQPPSARTYSAQHVVVEGEKDGVRTEVAMTALTVPNEAWGLGGGIISTASVAAATARLYAGGRMPHVGAMPPERCLEPEALFEQLESRGCTFSLQARQVTQSEAT